MDDPVSEITHVIETLCTARPAAQQDALEKYFTTDATFTHPFCRTGHSRWQIGQVYLWYKILSPYIDIHIDSIAFDQKKMTLYVSIHQTFKIWVIPFYNANPSLVTVLELSHQKDPVSMAKTYAEAVKTPADDDGQRESSDGNKWQEVSNKQRGSDDQGKRYYIKSQNDLYQTTEFIKFLVPFGVGSTLMWAWQLWATFLCIIGAFIGKPITWMEEQGKLGGVKRV